MIRHWTAAALLGAVVLAGPRLAEAEVFRMAHVSFGDQDAHADLLADGELRTEADGSRSLLVTRITLTPGDAAGLAANLDQTRWAFDCPARRYRVLSQTLYAGVDPSSKRTDKPIGGAPTAVEPGGEVEDLYLFACQGPRAVKTPMLAFQQQDLWAGIGQAADDLSRMIARAQRAGPPTD